MQRFTIVTNSGERWSITAARVLVTNSGALLVLDDHATPIVGLNDWSHYDASDLTATADLQRSEGTFDRTYVEQLRADCARYRQRAREAEAKLAAA